MGAPGHSYGTGEDESVITRALCAGTQFHLMPRAQRNECQAVFPYLATSLAPGPVTPRTCAGLGMHSTHRHKVTARWLASGPGQR